MHQVATAHGVCVLVELADGELDAALAALPAGERAHAATLTAIRRRDFIGGRTALRAALALLGAEARAPILADDRGAPTLPSGLTGSISHKGGIAGALAGDASGGFLGLDLERAAPPRIDVATRVLTARERDGLGLDGDARGRAVTLRFSIKEAIYKAVDPIVRRYVGFQEVELDVTAATAGVTHALPAALDAAWCEHAGLWVSTARAVRR